MIHKQSYKAYAAATQTVAKTKQVIMLYDAAINAVKKAKEGIEKGDIETRYNSLVKACEIIFGLQGCLDFEKGGEIAKTLYDFYGSVDMRLISVHRNNSAEICERVISELKSMRDAWIDIDKMDEEGALMEGKPALKESRASSDSKQTPPEGGVAISA